MKNYEDMSDFEINKAVALIVGATFNDDGAPVRFVECDAGAYADFNEIEFDPCNNVEQAWPIIVKHEIDVIQNNGQDCPLATNSAVMMFRGDDVFICQHENPLRSAMIVFLKMNEDKL